MEMRKAYSVTMAELMKQNDKIVILDADLAKACATTTLHAQFPNRSYDLGICEQNMMSVAVGLSYYGYIPFVHSFAPFAVRRAYDQIAMGVAYGRANVKIVGTDPGICATLNGGTHMSFEDVSAMRAIPNMLIYEPTDCNQLIKALPQIVAHEGACYIRMTRKDDLSVFGQDYIFDLYKADIVREGNDLTMIVCGINTPDCVTACQQLAQEGVSVDLISVHTVKPLDNKTIIDSATKTGRVLVVENSNYKGGLYGAVCECLAINHPTYCDHISSEDKLGEVGNLDELKSFYSMTVKDIIDKSKRLIQK
ncbi:MAG: transketolase C-terminal domain-containing protein [Clostridia bacterium]|nr:transketolase C-terminal domain-containing protein [Clostridia bacterium]